MGRLGFQLFQLDLAQPLLEVALRGDRLGVAARVAGGDRRRQHVDQEVRVRVQEERHRVPRLPRLFARSEEHTSELQSLMRISYAVFCLKKKKKKTNIE